MRDKGLRILRKKSGYTRQYVAMKLSIHPRYFNRIENGEGAMPETRAKILGVLFNVSKEEIIKIWREENERNFKENNETNEGDSKS